MLTTIIKLKAVPLVLIVTLLSFLMYSPLIPTVKAADEYDALRAKWHDMLVGDSTYSTTDPDNAAQITSITNTTNSNWSTLLTAADRTSLWSDLTNWTLSGTITSSYSRLKDMAIAYATRGSTLYGNSALSSDIISALDWMAANKYNATKTEVDNWWHWEIGTPQILNDTMVLMYDQLSAAQISSYISAIDKWCPDPTKLISGGTVTGANRSDKAQVVVIRGIVGKTAAKIAQGRDALSQIFPYVTSFEGFYTDGSFIQHTNIAYTGSYGAVLIDGMAKLFYILNGSTWTITNPSSSNVYSWVTKGFQPLIYQGAMMDMTRGRAISRQSSEDHAGGRLVIVSILQLAQAAPAVQGLAFKSMVKAWVQSDTTFSNYYAGLSIFQISLLKSLMNDSSITPSGELVKNQVFASMDRVAHLSPGFGFGLGMFSTRISAFEYGNGENKKGWFTGVGMTTLYNKDLNQFGGDYWPTVNMFRLPGTTTDGSGSGTNPIDWKSYPNPNNWVGGSSLNGLYGTAGMQFSMSQNTGTTLQGKKSWFMFADKVAALGAGITSTDNRTVETIVENRKLNGSGNNALTVNGTVKSAGLGWSETMTGVQWAHLAGSVPGSDIGYYFPGTATINGLRESRTSSWSAINTTQSSASVTKNYLSLAFGHGMNPTNGSYAYVLLPNKNAAATASYAGNPDIIVLENSTDAQAVKDTSLNAVGVNFWNDVIKTVSVTGTSFITSDKKASVMTSETSSQIDVAVSDPTQANTGTINIEIQRSASGAVSLSSGVTVTQLSPTIKLTVNVNGAKGKTFEAKFDLSVVTLGAVEDSFVRDGTYATTNFGTSTFLDVKNETSSYNRKSLFKFDVSSMTGSISNAKVVLVPVAVGTTGITNQAYLISDNTWGETAVIWNNQPTVSTFLGNLTVLTVGATVEINVTSQVNAAITGDKKLSIHVSSPTNQGSLGWVQYGARENTTASYRPVLVITK